MIMNKSLKYSKKINKKSKIIVPIKVKLKNFQSQALKNNKFPFYKTHILSNQDHSIRLITFRKLKVEMRSQIKANQYKSRVK